ncbi:MAG: dTDP-4-dehydrorhamnose 3,5-epimerase [Syntrophobacteraceae bacterium]
MRIFDTSIPGVLKIEPAAFKDNRGHFLEVYHSSRYSSEGIAKPFLQDNLSYSVKGVLRGLHYQLGRPQAKLVMVVEGEIFDVAVDIRKGSPTFGKWTAITLSSENRFQMFIPEGFAHGFCVLSGTAAVLYKCSDLYAPEEERGLRWNDPSLAIEWPMDDPVLSAKDAGYPLLSTVSPEDLP